MTVDHGPILYLTQRKRNNKMSAASLYKHHQTLNSSMRPPLYFTIRFSKPCLMIALFAASVSILFLAETTHNNHLRQVENSELGMTIINSTASSTLSASTSKALDSLEADEVQIKLPSGSRNDEKTLQYYRCGSTSISSSTYESKDIELILLHGAKFTKENWKESNILQNLCLKGNEDTEKNGRMSVIALDLSVQADGLGLESAFDALVDEGVLSGQPAAFVTPSASGKSVVSLVTEKKTSLLKKMIKVWMPVASFSVLTVKNDDLFKIFVDEDIPILAMNGDEDKQGQKVTTKLVEAANAKGVEIKGGHPCYLDSPTYFVDSVISFLHGLGVDSS